MPLSISHAPDAHATLCRQFTWELAWHPARDYPAASQLELRAHCLRSFLNWGIVASEVSGADVVFRWKVKPTVSEMWRNRERVILRAKLQYGARRTQSLTIRLTCIPPVWTQNPLELSVWTIGPSDPWQVDSPLPDAVLEPGNPCRLTCTAGPVERLRLDSRPMPDGGQVRTLIAPQDRYGNPARFAEEVPLRLQWGDRVQELRVSEKTLVDLPAQPRIARAQASLALGDLAPAENVANGSIDGDRVTVTGNPVWPEPVDGLSPAFGEIHWHTDFSSDGQRPIANALDSARDDLNLDFAAPGDHNPHDARWEKTVTALEAAHQPPLFMTFFGWENSSGSGHENYYFTRPDHPMVCGGEAGLQGGIPESVKNTLRQHDDFLAIPHHTNAVAESRRLEDDAPYWHPYAWSEPTGAHRLIEIFQGRGNQERDDYPDAWRGWHQNHGASAQEALARGYRLGFTGGTDNHCGWPGRAYSGAEGAGQYPPYSQILTGVWLSRRDRQTLFDSLYARCTWAVWDTRAIAWFTVNGAPMGSELSVYRGTRLEASLRLSSEAPTQAIEIVSDGQVVWQGASHRLDLELTMPLGDATAATHFYLRVLFRDGGILYASPVFLDIEDEP